MARDRQTAPSALSPLLEFLRTEAAGGVLLVAGAVAALIWANSPWSSSYESFWSAPASISLADHTLDLARREWVNEGLITLLFFVVGLEIKREMTEGQLASKRAALLPVAAAAGGMLAPALIYMAIAGGNAPRGWAIVVATDIALSLGVLSFAGSAVSSALRIFLLAIAIVDDIGALLIIALVYSTDIGWGWLALAVCVVLAVVVARRVGLRQVWVYAVLGCLLWMTLHSAGVNPTLAGVAMALLTPMTPWRGSDVTVVEWLEHRVHPWASYLVVPLFALANSGITFTTDLLHAAVSSPVTWAIIVGRVVGKPAGITLTTKALVRAGRADQPGEASDRQLVGVAASSGMGFTVALFITDLAFHDRSEATSATLAVLVAATIAGALSLTILAGQQQAEPDMMTR